MHNNPETPWEIIVAHAAPATPIEKLTINTMSKTIFNIEATIKKYKGVLLSPRALNIPAIIL